MSKYIPKISLMTSPTVGTILPQGDPLHDEVAAEVAKHSITPRTLNSVNVFNIAGGPHTTIEEYSYVGNTVLRYSIRAETIVPDPSGTILGEGTSGPKGPSVKTAAYKDTTARAAILHNLEKEIITQAITSFVSGSAITAVVDIFERSFGVAINTEAGHPIAHSVVLHFIAPSGIVCVIDPSNFLYSSHLQNTDFEAELVTKGLPPIRTIHKEVKIYTPIKPEGYAFDKHRDCSDIAVKIAFELNTSPLPIASFSYPDIKSYDVIVSVSNNVSEIDKSIIVDKIPARVKQASSHHAEKTFNTLQSSIDYKIKICAGIQPALSGKWKTDFAKIMTTQAKHADILAELALLDQDMNTDFTNVLSARHAMSASKFADFTTECAGLDPDYYDY